VPFKCTCRIYHGWDPSENARIVSMTESQFRHKAYTVLLLAIFLGGGAGDLFLAQYQ
jgi:hypothetical protein